MGKEDVYQLLLGTDGWVEINEIANRLNISYRATWSAVHGLKESKDVEFKQEGKKKMVKVVL